MAINSILNIKEKFLKNYKEKTLSRVFKYYISKFFYKIFLLKYIHKLSSKKHLLCDIPRSKHEFRIARLDGVAVVYGSAPSASIPNGYQDSWKIITANSSQYLTDKLGLKKPDISIVCTTSFLHGSSHEETVYNEGATKALYGRSTNHLIMAEDKICSDFRRKIRNEKIIKSLRRNKNEYNSIEFMPYAFRYKFSADILGHEYSLSKNVSTGFFAALLAYKIGASKVVMSGFSFSNHKHGYPDEYFNQTGGRGDLGRGEITGDIIMLDWIKKNKLPFYAAEQKFAEESGLEYWK